MSLKSPTIWQGLSRVYNLPLIWQELSKDSFLSIFIICNFFIKINKNITKPLKINRQGFHDAYKQFPISWIVSNPYFPAFSRHLFITCLLPEISHMLRYCFIIHRNHEFCNAFSGFYNCSNWTCSDSPER